MCIWGNVKLRVKVKLRLHPFVKANLNLKILTFKLSLCNFVLSNFIFIQNLIDENLLPSKNDKSITKKPLVTISYIY